MKYANFCDTGRCNINIGDYLQFMAADYLYSLTDIPQEEIVYLGFRDLASYSGEEVIFPFCYSIIDFVVGGRITISERIKPVFFSVTLSTIDKFMDLDEFLSDSYNQSYLLKHSPIGCRDEITYDLFTRHGIPAYINGCMTAAFPRYTGNAGQKVLFVDAPKDLLPYVPDSLLGDYELSTQQYYFNEPEIADYREIFKFVKTKYNGYKKSARLAITSRLHVALPFAAFGIPVILAKDNVDGRFSFIESYLPIYSREDYSKINWTPDTPDFEDVKKLLVEHALGRIQNSADSVKLEQMESSLTRLFKSRTTTVTYKDSHAITHNNGDRFDEYAARFWEPNAPVRYALWGVSKNNSGFWRSHIQSKYPQAQLVAVFDSFKDGELFGLSYERPARISDYKDTSIIVCSVGAAKAALKLFKELGIDKSRYCITSDCFISGDDIEEMRNRAR